MLKTKTVNYSPIQTTQKFKVMKTKLIILSLIVWSINDLQAQFQIDAQFRVRSQLLHGYKKPVAKDVDPAFHIGQRTRLNLRYSEPKFKTLLSFQDVRIWGDENIVNPTGVKGKSYNTVDVYEAWIQLKLSEMSHLKIGRQEMKYDDQRHISWRNWWDRGQTYDAITYSFKNKKTGWQVDMSASYNSKAEDLTGNNYSDGIDYFGKVNPILTHNFIYLKKSINPKFYISLTGIGAGYQKEQSPDVIYMTYTEGVHINYNMTKKSIDGVFAKANAFIQNGKNIKGQDINAHMLTALLGYRTMNKKLEINMGYELLSGNDASNTDADYKQTDHTYNLLYGARHPYYEGYLDWFVVPKSALFGGTQTISANLQYKFTKKDMVKFAFNYVSLNKNIVKKNTSGAVVLNVDDGTNLAQVFDVMYVKKFYKFMQLHTGFSYGIASDEFNKMKGITEPGSNYFAYVMLTVKPTFFTSKK